MYAHSDAQYVPLQVGHPDSWLGNGLIDPTKGKGRVPSTRDKPTSFLSMTTSNPGKITMLHSAAAMRQRFPSMLQAFSPALNVAALARRIGA